MVIIVSSYSIAIAGGAVAGTIPARGAGGVPIIAVSMGVVGRTEAGSETAQGVPGWRVPLVPSSLIHVKHP